MKTIKNMFLANFEKIENFRLFDIDTPIDDFEVKKSKNFLRVYTQKFGHIHASHA